MKSSKTKHFRHQLLNNPEIAVEKLVECAFRVLKVTFVVCVRVMMMMMMIMITMNNEND